LDLRLSVAAVLHGAAKLSQLDILGCQPVAVRAEPVDGDRAFWRLVA
jgi:hypothetical protein